MNLELLQRLRATPEPELYRELYTDPLTGVLNRRAFEVLGLNRPFVAIVDADSLKWINDNLGHRAGDVHLCKVAAVLVGVFGLESVHRLAGDEFVVQSDDAARLGRALDACRLALPCISFGMGDSLEQADSHLRQDKADRERAGLRAARGERPFWAT